jgi:hypothetical protein
MGRRSRAYPAHRAKLTESTRLRLLSILSVETGLLKIPMIEGSQAQVFRLSGREMNLLAENFHGF